MVRVRNSLDVCVIRRVCASSSTVEADEISCGPEWFTIMCSVRH